MTTATANQDGAAQRDAERRLADAGAALAAVLGIPWDVKRTWDLQQWRLSLMTSAAELMTAVAENTAATTRFVEGKRGADGR